MCAVYYGKTPGFEIVHGLMDRLMQVLGVPFNQKSGNTYNIKSADGKFLHKIISTKFNNKYYSR